MIFLDTRERGIDMINLEIYGCWIQPIDFYGDLRGETYVIMAKCNCSKRHFLRLLVTKNELNLAYAEVFEYVHKKILAEFEEVHHNDGLEEMWNRS